MVVRTLKDLSLRNIWSITAYDQHPNNLLSVEIYRIDVSKLITRTKKKNRCELYSNMCSILSKWMTHEIGG